ncbi:MAG: Flp pilus assembly protein CpaB [Candidatus Aquicultor secundus]|uniref:Flp pilus assembly protein CpaB n=3 Tax=Candidatus Aquicultor secundus TaxID=1973895 RepID=A0A2M7T7T1_9ACTN|nr:Flp pilus assembly protein CpaB [Candidatus Aquicultor secundus]NCO65391.1 Flp pilus assembly protein CpaB [Solirubrobacter sp.]OIO85590.1 MAG: Flp pilus assembly protein CpaB [Candidatus Aquicultor secundus]PIW21596.1 MAG: Flp pilus assembly protein CpaB [Candidatus Aquicultor secundus]PIZ38583.1 MAG: Flp pilus assembly protein CpaB [Candidatus Aquicultor secundus]PJB78783.1 MAG: Flp pilus assembly protein CpaB [Candidatus Aquicultor secundus]
MKPRLVIIIVAVILGAIVALGVNSYLNNIKKQAVEEQKTVQVWVANHDIEKGTSIEDITTNRLAQLKEVPRRYVASQAISSTRNIEGQVLSVSISAGEQLTIGKFKHPSEAGLSFTVPKGYLAVSIPYDSIRGIAGMAKPGDLVTVFASFNPGADGDDVTKILLQKVQVIAVGESVGAEKETPNARTPGSSQVQSGSDNSKKTITLALVPADAEKLVYAQENGKVWLGLHAPTNAEAVATKGVTIKTIFK